MTQGVASEAGGGSEGLMVSVSGIRGRVGAALTPEVVAKYAGAFGAWSLSQGISRQIVVGRDSRVSGQMFHRIVVGTLQLVGCDVIDIGLTTTPGCQLAVEFHHAAGGLMLSASHNPIEWNALKLIGSSGLFLEASEGLAMRALVETGIPYASWDKIGSVISDEAAAARHIEAVLAIPYVDVEAIRARHFKVALDCVRGAGATIMPTLLERLGCEVVGINMEPDGRFQREPEPIPANLGELARLVRETGADIGLAVDPDVDRLALVSDAGTPSVSDPGQALVKAAWSAGHTVVPIPGPSSVTAALSIAGYGGPGFTFLGYLPRKPGEMRRLLATLVDDARPAVAFDSPYRVVKSLAVIAEILPKRHITVGRELTKLHEEVLRGTADEVRSALGDRARGEFTLVISGSQ